MNRDNNQDFLKGAPSTDDLIARVKARRRMQARGALANVGVQVEAKSPVHAANDRRPLALRVLLDPK